MKIFFFQEKKSRLGEASAMKQMSTTPFRILRGCRVFVRLGIYAQAVAARRGRDGGPSPSPTIRLPSVSAAGSTLHFRPARFPPYPRRFSRLAAFLADPPRARHSGYPPCLPMSIRLSAVPSRCFLSGHVGRHRLNILLPAVSADPSLLLADLRPPPDHPANPPCPRRVSRLDASSR